MSGIHLHTQQEWEFAQLQVAQRLLQMVVAGPHLETGVHLKMRRSPEDPELAQLG